MWNYEKRLQYPVNIKTPNAKIAQIIMSQYGGPDGRKGWLRFSLTEERKNRKILRRVFGEKRKTEEKSMENSLQNF